MQGGAGFVLWAMNGVRNDLCEYSIPPYQDSWICEEDA